MSGDETSQSATSLGDQQYRLTRLGILDQNGPEDGSVYIPPTPVSWTLRPSCIVLVFVLVPVIVLVLLFVLVFGCKSRPYALCDSRVPKRRWRSL
jgi:hypothetical protein